MAKCVFFLILLVIFLWNDAYSKRHGNRNVKNSDGKIVGGYNTTIQDYPYQAYVVVQKGVDYYQCGGSIISSRYILTAAHCLVGVTSVYVRLGSTNSDSGGKLYFTQTFRMHPKYTSRTSDYDVAYVDLGRNVKLDGQKTKAIDLPKANTNIPTGTQIIVTGWGDTTESGSTSQNLMAVKIPTISSENCKKSYSYLTSRMFCAGVPEGGKDSCQGDSGGPAVSEKSGIQLGVVSFGTGCARPNYPGVYTNISAVRDWIKTNTGV